MCNYFVQEGRGKQAKSIHRTPERSDGKRSEGSKRKAEDADEENRLKNTVKYLQKAEAIAEIAEVELSEEFPDTEEAGEMQDGEGEQELDFGAIGKEGRA